MNCSRCVVLMRCYAGLVQLPSMKSQYVNRAVTHFREHGPDYFGSRPWSEDCHAAYELNGTRPRTTGVPW